MPTQKIITRIEDVRRSESGVEYKVGHEEGHEWVSHEKVLKYVEEGKLKMWEFKMVQKNHILSAEHRNRNLFNVKWRNLAGQEFETAEDVHVIIGFDQFHAALDRDEAFSKIFGMFNVYAAESNMEGGGYGLFKGLYPVCQKHHLNSQKYTMILMDRTHESQCVPIVIIRSSIMAKALECRNCGRIHVLQHGLMKYAYKR